MNQIQTSTGPILTTDGIPLKVSLKKAERINKIRAFLLVLPLLAFILITFIIPIGDMLTRSVDDRYINTVFPKTFEVYKKWDKKGISTKTKNTQEISFIQPRLSRFRQYLINLVKFA